jgi:hypothetical protein
LIRGKSGRPELPHHVAEITSVVSDGYMVCVNRFRLQMHLRCIILYQLNVIMLLHYSFWHWSPTYGKFRDSIIIKSKTGDSESCEI